MLRQDESALARLVMEKLQGIFMVESTQILIVVVGMTHRGSKYCKVM